MLTWGDVAIVIRAVDGKRQHLLRRLETQLQAAGLGYSVSLHRPGRTVPESYVDALSRTSGRLWTMQMEDDAVLCPEFNSRALAILRSCTTWFVSFYSGRRLKDGEHLPPLPVLETLPGARFLMAQCFAIRSEVVAAHNEYVLNFTRDRPFATDMATAAWMQAHRMRFSRTWPSLVQHDDSGESLYGHRPNQNRRSQSFAAAWGNAGC